MFIRIITDIVSASNHAKCVSLNNKKCMTQPTVINLHPNEYSQGLYYYLFAVNLDRCVESCNIINDLSNKVCFPNKTEDLNLGVFSMIAGINEFKTLRKHISCKCGCKFDGKRCMSNRKWNNDKCPCKCKNPEKTSCVQKRIYLYKYIRIRIILLHEAVKMVDI